MKWAPLRAAGDSKIPLLATIPTGMAWICANPVTKVGPKSGLNSANLEPSVIRAIISWAGMGRRRFVPTTPASSDGSYMGSDQGLAVSDSLSVEFEGIVMAWARGQFGLATHRW